MACIGCGLALNADGKGRVDIDTEGGLECTGVGDGGTSNTANNGLRVKLNGTTGNAIVRDSNGLYVPPTFRLENHYGTQAGGPISDPLFGSGGSTYFSPSAAITITNTGAATKMFMYQVAIYYNNVTDVPVWMELAVQEAGGGYQVNSAQFVEAGSIMSPLIQLPTALWVAAGESKTVDAKMALYRGNLNSYRVSIVAWGGYA